MTRYYQRYSRGVVLGYSRLVYSSLLLYMLALVLVYYCQDGINRPLSPMDEQAIYYIRKHWIEPPTLPPARPPSSSSLPPNRPPLKYPSWAESEGWGRAFQLLKDFFSQYKKPGTYVEVGAGDGEFRSLTLYLEKALGFRGLLVEPHPRLYAEMREKRKGANTIHACATPDYGHRLDRDLGRTVGVQCFNVGTMAIAALARSIVDLVVISTGGGEAEIFASFPSHFEAKVVVLVMTVMVNEEWDWIVEGAANKGLKLVRSFDTHHIFINNKRVSLTII
ncbi:hypothetical protein Pcinc_043539 [Petrolisthes cinctipes]|uniref:Methyltransferase domain-containing protein n=1 Tax=Petrolisthes cinctipes TaxID=88211 RepID=A0AAE1EG60_PETCI|nr:hypothetical protein Pcinc_043539 [Petrolisthes cinctipes]